MAERNARYEAARTIIAKLDGLRNGGDAFGGIAQAERLEDRNAIGPDLYPRAHLAERGRPLEDPDPCVALSERDRRGQTCDPASDNDDVPPREMHSTRYRRCPYSNAPHPLL